MTTSLMFEPMPRPWSIDTIAGPDGRLRERLRIGRREVDLADVTSVAEDRVTERDVRGLAIMAGAFALAAIVLLVGVTDLGWRTRFLIGAVFLGALALASYGEVLTLRAIHYRRLVVTTRRGATLVFTSADDREVDALARALGVELRA